MLIKTLLAQEKRIGYRYYPVGFYNHQRILGSLNTYKWTPIIEDNG